MSHKPISKPTRRNFLKTTSAIGGSLIIMGTKATAGIKGANDRVRIAVAGVNGRGNAHIGGWMKAENVELIYVIDPAENVLQNRLKGIEKRAEGKFTTKGLSDFREALDDKSLDAISIATPNHWHSLMTIRAAQAGKHVYVEKPLSHDVAEGRVAVEAQKKYGIVVQHGTQRRSDSGIAGLHELLKSGDLPKLKIAYGYCCKPRGSIGTKPNGAPPSNLNWDLWKGPAVIDQYHANYHPYNWHWFWETGNGDLNNQGTHQLDIARWAIDDDQTHPVRMMAMGGRFQWDDQGETPNTMFSMAEYPNGQQVFFNVRNVNHEGYKTQVYNEYYLEDGSVITGEGRYKILRPGADKPEELKVPSGNVTPGGHFNAFISAVRANDPSMANGNVMDAHYGCVLGHLMNNSYRLGSEVPFNAKAGQFGDNKDAAIHFGKLHSIMKDGVGVPENEAKYVVGPTLTFDPETEKHTGEFATEANQLLKDPNNANFKIPQISEV
ncbi:4-carboxy-2-hydroxymuconate-6-semialdehyde dehydrogenase [Novipirellula galeiformis]|uniref:4-carboxy-2-hydroxymuconate-6-semialdehyde dehydrogenase n=1 Tax=Novipirellula galeiformis TaxID=2528004 RepID=A0A5C6BGK9_9BACT|nr:Gfo/Idh/MocA family oxidoreductase [Novipirellula galeiformis]TWU11178.1 4-carboxy-2-hydroxymuconate-6-semialdehyde dehydrogenase [Novipirellula galeiformis]